MTDNEIIKALKICFEDEECTGCPLENNESECEKFNIWEEAFNLINRQKAEIERLKSPAEMQIEVSEEIEKSIKAEAVKEFVERLKRLPIWSSTDLFVIDNLVKEMVGEG